MKFVIFLAGLIGFSSQAEWSYNYETQWPGQCRSGALQSPINIMSRSALLDPHGAHLRGPLLFRGYGRVPLTAQNTGHTLQWNAVEGDGGGAPVLAGGPLRGNYTFLQFHLHWLSEHAIDGMKYPLEIHLVHVKTGLTEQQATQRPDGIAVVAVLCQVRSDDADSERALAELMPALPLLLEQTEHQTEPMHLDLRRLLSSNLQSYYTYHGSLTTPNCYEVVTWIVMDVPIHISDTQYKELSRVDVGGVDNYRSLQAVNRAVYRSRAPRLAAAPLAALPLLLHCLSAALPAPLLAGARRSLCLLWNAKRKLLAGGARHVQTCDQ